MTDPVVMPRAQALLECLREQIALVSTPPARVGFRTGDTVEALISQVANECCDGMAWVRVVRFFPSSEIFPEQDSSPLPKGTSAWAIELEVGAMRCAPTDGPTGIPSVEDWDNLTVQIMDDAAAMRRAICCYIEGASSRIRNTLPGEWSPLPTEGGCAGGTLSVIVRAPACDCSEVS